MDPITFLDGTIGFSPLLRGITGCLAAYWDDGSVLKQAAIVYVKPPRKQEQVKLTFPRSCFHVEGCVNLT